MCGGKRQDRGQVTLHPMGHRSPRPSLDISFTWHRYTHDRTDDPTDLSERNTHTHIHTKTNCRTLHVRHARVMAFVARPLIFRLSKQWSVLKMSIIAGCDAMNCRRWVEEDEDEGAGTGGGDG